MLIVSVSRVLIVCVCVLIVSVCVLIVMFLNLDVYFCGPGLQAMDLFQLSLLS